MSGKRSGTIPFYFPSQKRRRVLFRRRKLSYGSRYNRRVYGRGGRKSSSIIYRGGTYRGRSSFPSSKKYSQRASSVGDTMLATFQSAEYTAVSAPAGASVLYQYNDILFQTDGNLNKAVTPYIQMWNEFKVTNIKTIWWMNDDDQIVTADQIVGRIQTSYDDDSRGQTMTTASIQTQPNMREDFIKPFQVVHRDYRPEFYYRAEGALTTQSELTKGHNDWRDTVQFRSGIDSFSCNNGLQVAHYGSATNKLMFKLYISVLFRGRRVNKVYAASSDKTNENTASEADIRRSRAAGEFRGKATVTEEPVRSRT